MMIAQVAAGLLCTLLGGYIAARMGKGLPLLHALAVGVLAVAWSVIGWALSPMLPLPLWGVLAVATLTIPAAARGRVDLRWSTVAGTTPTPGASRRYSS